MHRSLRTLAIWARCLALAAAPLHVYAEVPAVDKIVDRTSHEIAAYLDHISDVTCTEQVSQLRLAANGKVLTREEATYSYLILLQGTQDDFLLSESRLQQSPQRKPEKNVSLLLTNGFSMLFLIFHPYYTESYHFELRDEALIDGMTVVRVHFTPIPGARTLAALALRGREYPLELTGDAWINPATGTITRIQATLANDLSDVGLRSFQVEVRYAPVHLPAWPVDYVFPSAATVEVETARQHWRNIHHFTGYKSFSVNTEQNVADQQFTEQQSANKQNTKRRKNP